MNKKFTLVLSYFLLVSYASAQSYSEDLWPEKLLEIPSHNFDPKSFDNVDANFFSETAQHIVQQCAKEVLSELAHTLDLDFNINPDHLIFSHRTKKVFFKSSGKIDGFLNSVLGTKWFVLNNFTMQDYKKLVQRKPLLYKIKAGNMLRVLLPESRAAENLQPYEELINVTLSPVSNLHVLGDWFYFSDTQNNKTYAIDLTIRGLEIVPTVGNALPRYAIYCSTQKLSENEQHTALNSVLGQTHEPQDPDPLNPWTWPVLNWIDLDDPHAFVNFFYTIRHNKSDFFRAVTRLSIDQGPTRGLNIFNHDGTLQQTFNSAKASNSIIERARAKTVELLGWNQSQNPFNITQHGGYNLNTYINTEKILN